MNFKKMAGVPDSRKGFTLIEMLVVVSVIGLLAAIAAPGWFSFVERNRLGAAVDELHLAIKEAQSEAQYKGSDWRFSLRENNGSVEWAVHSNSIAASSANWQTLSSQQVQIDAETTFVRSGEIYYVRFDTKGNPSRLGRLTLSGKRFSNNKRCVIVSTLIGATRKAKEHKTPDPNYRVSDRFCY